MTHLTGKRVLLGVSGGISAFKAVLTLRGLMRAGAEVTVVMTKNAERFVGAATFAGLSGRPVITDLFDVPNGLSDDERRMPHLVPAETADLAIVVPATANTLAKMAHGIADNALTTTLLSVRCPVLAAPAMDTDMWTHPATQDNVRTLKARGVAFVGPVTGELARRNHGAGRLVEPEEIVAMAEHLLAEEPGVESEAGALAGLKALVTAGGTREAIDPVRYIGNRSSGKMGIAVARALVRRGADVTLVSAATSVPPPAGCRVVEAGSAAEMHAATVSLADEMDAFVMAAAVADYAPKAAAAQKIKKGASPGLTLELSETPDIAADLGRQKRASQTLVIFAAETDRLLEHAADKLRKKGADLIVANDVSKSDSGFEVDTNEVVLMYADGRAESLPLMSKVAVAERIAVRIGALRAAKGGA